MFQYLFRTLFCINFHETGLPGGFPQGGSQYQMGEISTVGFWETLIGYVMTTGDKLI